MFRLLAVCLGFGLLACASPLAAQENATDVVDVWHAVRHPSHHGSDENNGDTGDPSTVQASGPAETVDKPKDFFVLAPTFGSKPSTGLTAGLNSNVAFFEGGDSTATHISSMSAGLRVSQEGQILSGLRFAVFTADDRWFLQGDNRLQWTSLNTYGLGSAALGAGAEDLSYDFVRLYETAYRQISPGLFVGAGVNVDDHSNVRARDGALAPFDQSAYVAYSRAHHFSTDGQASTGASIGLLYDTRDNAINASRGSFASATVRAFSTALGGDSTWQELSFDARTYRRLTDDGRHLLAFWMLGDFVAGGTAPYFDLPTIAGDGRSARGYAEGRYRGEHLLYGEIEYRSALTKNDLLGYVAFVNTTTVSSADDQERLFASWAPGAGGGLRVLLNKRSRTNLCADYGWGKAGSRGFYLAIQEAF